MTHVFVQIFKLLFQHFHLENTVPNAAVIASTDAILKASRNLFFF